MKRINVLAVISTLLLASCIKGADYMGPESTPSNKVSQDKINVNAAKVFGTSFSADQDWSSTKKYTVSVTADAPMADITKVQILTEAPYFNEDARVLNEASAKNGQTVSITFDCPSEYTELVAACVDSKGVYYVTGFKAGDSSVSFTTRASTRAEYDLPAFPDVSGLKMYYKNSHLTYNAMRARMAGQEGEAANIDPWKNSNWDDERIWLLSNKGGNSTWKVEKQAIYRKVSMTDAEKVGLETILNAVGGKKAQDQEYKNKNLETIRNSPVYELTKNYLIADGKAPITVTPVQMLTADINNVCLYYYYFKPSDLEGKLEEEQITFLKNLPKFKCVDGKLTKSNSGTNNSGKNGDYFKVHEYVLPFFGDVTSNTTDDITVQSFTIPKGYYIGFMLRKTKELWDDSYSTDNDIYTTGTGYTKKSYNKTNNGEVYADGRLNQQINQYPDFKSAVDKYSMKLDDPRAAIFGANQKAYLMFEDGTDVNYADIIVEINGGLQEVDAAQQINNNVYTFCFEDRDLGDYDMNDVVIKAERLNMTQVKYTVAACGANDELYLRNINGEKLNETPEIHTLFGANNSTIINTQSMNYEPVSEVITVDPSFSFTDFSQQVYIYNKTQGYDVKMAQKGEDPHGIMIPCDFAYPKEKTCIKDAYLKFNSWGENPVTSTDWYLEPVEGKVIK